MSFKEFDIQERLSMKNSQGNEDAMRKIDRKKLGKFGEVVAKKYLQECGYRFVTGNFNCRFGEIDLIFTKGNRLVFCEVKTRTGDNFGNPCESVNKSKIKHMKRSALYYMSTHDCGMMNPTFDVIEVFINHIENVL